jgi:predicted O-linked N-acetylglucosamine transferase (SPINDLY family)
VLERAANMVAALESALGSWAREAAQEQAEIPADVSSAVRNLQSLAQRQLAELEAKIAELNQTLRADEAACEAARNTMPAMEEAVADARVAWEQAPSGELKDTTTLIEKLQQAGLTNREIDRRERRRQLEEQLDAKEKESRQLSRAMTARDEEKHAAVAGAQMPCEGMTIEGESILLKGVPLKQLGEAQQLFIGIRVNLARNPRLRLVRIDRGECLDEENMRELYRMAEELDFTAWVAKVDSSGKIGIYLEDGEVKAVNG